MAFAKEKNIIISEEWRVPDRIVAMVPDAQNYFEVQAIISKEKPTNTVESSDENVTAGFMHSKLDDTELHSSLRDAPTCCADHDQH